jgi:hypothetical protein
MAKSILDQLREHLEDVERAWVFFAMSMLVLLIIAGLVLLGVYFYTRH